MMLSFATFDKAVEDNNFWTQDNMGDLSAQIRGKHGEDAEGRSGLTLVVGCPLPTPAQKYVAGLRQDLSRRLAQCGIAEPVWRTELSALHVTVYGLLVPDDYERDRALCDSLMKLAFDDLSEAAHGWPRFTMTLKGFGILGRGALAVRVADSAEVTQIRDHAASIPQVSSRGYVERRDLNQMVIGRLQPCLEDGQRQMLRGLYEEFKDSELHELVVDSLSLVRYEHEFLTQISSCRIITLG